MLEFTAPSGAIVVINPAPWQDAKALKNAIMREAAKAGIRIDTEEDVSQILSAILNIDSSDDVDAALMKCLARCTRDQHKITGATFDDAEARQDYYQIVWECGKANLGPLFEPHIARLKGFLPKKTTGNIPT